jgi:hypothetical protein
MPHCSIFSLPGATKGLRQGMRHDIPSPRCSLTRPAGAVWETDGTTGRPRGAHATRPEMDECEVCHGFQQDAARPRPYIITSTRGTREARAPARALSVGQEREAG